MSPTSHAPSSGTAPPSASSRILMSHFTSASTLVALNSDWTPISRASSPGRAVRWHTGGWRTPTKLLNTLFRPVRVSNRRCETWERAFGSLRLRIPLGISWDSLRIRTLSLPNKRLKAGGDRSRGSGVLCAGAHPLSFSNRSEEHTSELQSHSDLVCRLLLEKKKR